jgi:hypothetical protein
MPKKDSYGISMINSHNVSRERIKDKVQSGTNTIISEGSKVPYPMTLENYSQNQMAMT